MDVTGVNAGARAALSALKESYKIGNEGAKLIGEIQSGNREAVQAAQKQREQERRHIDSLATAQEQRAYQKLLNKAAAAKTTAALKTHILETYGEKAWDEYECLRIEVEKEDLSDAKIMKSDELRINSLFWWCIVLAIVVAYFAVVP